MANDPLISALHNGPKQPKIQRIHAPTQVHVPGARVLHFHSSEVPNLGNVKAGDKVTLKVHGHIQTMHDDGRTEVHVHQVESDGMSDLHSQEAPSKPPIVRLDSSHG